MDSRSLAKQLIGAKIINVEGIAFKSKLSYSTVRNWLSGKSIEPENERAIRAVLDELNLESTQKAAG